MTKKITTPRHLNLRKVVTKDTLAFVRDEGHVAGIETGRRGRDVMCAAIEAIASDYIKAILQNSKARDPKSEFVTSIVDADYANFRQHTEPGAKQLTTKGGVGFRSDEDKEKLEERKRTREAKEAGEEEKEEEPKPKKSKKSRD